MTTPTETCPNCGAAAPGRFCGQCGQPQRRAGSTLTALLGEAFAELTDVDGRVLGTVGTILFRPGRITRDYFAFRRARYLPPFRTYLWTMVALYFSLGLIGRVRFVFDFNLDASGTDSPWLHELARRAAAADSAAIGTTLFSYLPQVGFVLLPLAAWLLQALYYPRRRPFGDHLVTALHMKTGIGLILLLASLVAALGAGLERRTGLVLASYAQPVISAAGWASLVYLIVGMHVVYGGRLWLNVLRGLLLGSLYVTAATAVLMVTYFVMVWFSVPP